MISESHETILHEIRFSFSRFMRDCGYRFPGKVGFFAEAIGANLFTGLVGIGLVADGYIFPNDRNGVIPVEVGTMKPGKWSGVTATGGKAVRVFRVDFDRTVWMLNRRNTEFEEELLQFYAARLDPSVYSLPLFP
jgi:hypothetical protein